MNTAQIAVRAREPSTVSKSKLWIWVVVAFAVQLAIWTGWLAFAARHPVAEVPLASETRRTP
jgi:hypothetical protein